MAHRGPDRKAAHSLLAVSSAAVLAVYAAGYIRTRQAADRFDLEASRRRRVPALRAAAPTEPSPSAVAPASPSPLPFVTQRVAASPRPRPRPRPSLPKVVASVIGAEPSPLELPAQPKAAEGQTAPAESTVTPQPEEAPVADVLSPAAPDPAAPFKDGRYTGWGYSRHGDLQAELLVEQGRIASARIARCLTRYPCSWIERLPPEVVSRQGPPITYVSGASESSDAFYDAVLDALSHAK